MTLGDLRRLAVALESTSDYLIGLGDDYGGSYELAAAKMSFAYFERDLRTRPLEPEKSRRYRRIFEKDDLLIRHGAPRTVEDWKVAADMVDAAIGPRPPQIGEARRA